MKKLLIASMLTMVASGAQAQWKNGNVIEPDTDVAINYAVSTYVRTTDKDDFMHAYTLSYVGAKCNEEEYQTYFGFSVSPSIANERGHNGYSTIRAKIMFDDNMEMYDMVRDDDDRNFLYVVNDVQFLERLTESSTLTLLLNWESEGTVKFKYDLVGSKTSIHKMSVNC